MHLTRFRFLVLLVLAVVPFHASVLAQSTTGGIEVFSPDEEVGGATYADWLARSWQWGVSMPEEANPNFDPTGAKCGYGQSGPVFFVPALYTAPEPGQHQTCVVPTDTALYVTVASAECSTVEPPPFFGRTEAELAACAEASMDDYLESFSFTVNGVAVDVPNLEDYRVTTSMFTMLFPEENFFGVLPGPAQSVASGYALILKPLPVGTYEFEFTAMFADAEEPWVVQQAIVVQEPNVVEPAASPVASPAS